MGRQGVKKIALILMLAFTITGCRFSLEPSICDGCVPPTYVQDKNTTNETTAVIYYYEESCYDEPYYYAAEWCEWYDDSTTCCVWYSDGWYEEYCQSPIDYCWDYNGSF